MSISNTVWLLIIILCVAGALFNVGKITRYVRSQHSRGIQLIFSNFIAIILAIAVMFGWIITTAHPTWAQGIGILILPITVIAIITSILAMSKLPQTYRRVLVIVIAVMIVVLIVEVILTILKGGF